MILTSSYTLVAAPRKLPKEDSVAHMYRALMEDPSDLHTRHALIDLLLDDGRQEEADLVQHYTINPLQHVEEPEHVRAQAEALGKFPQLTHTRNWVGPLQVHAVTNPPPEHPLSWQMIRLTLSRLAREIGIESGHLRHLIDHLRIGNIIDGAQAQEFWTELEGIENTFQVLGNETTNTEHPQHTLEPRTYHLENRGPQNLHQIRQRVEQLLHRTETLLRNIVHAIPTQNNPTFRVQRSDLQWMYKALEDLRVAGQLKEYSGPYNSERWRGWETNEL